MLCTNFSNMRLRGQSDYLISVLGTFHCSGVVVDRSIKKKGEFPKPNLQSALDICDR